MSNLTNKQYFFPIVNYEGFYIFCVKINLIQKQTHWVIYIEEDSEFFETRTLIVMKRDG